MEAWYKGKQRCDRNEDLEDIKVEFQGNRYLPKGRARSLKTDPDLESLSFTATMDAAKAIHEQKAVKLDDAEVLENLWQEHLFDNSGWADVWLDDKERFKKACKLLKKDMIPWWKTTVTNSLNIWIDCQYPPTSKRTSLSLMWWKGVTGSYSNGGEPSFLHFITPGPEVVEVST